jgi:hypothetical protein
LPRSPWPAAPKARYGDFAPQGQEAAVVEDLAEMNAKGMNRTSAGHGPHLQGREGKLEIWKQKSNGRYDVIATYDDLQMVRAARAEVHRGRPPGARGLLHGPPGADEPELELSSRLQHRLSERLRPRQRPHRLEPDGARRLLVVGLLFDDDPQIEEIYAFGRDAFRAARPSSRSRRSRSA